MIHPSSIIWHLTALEALRDNYIWILYTEEKAILIDPGEADAALAWLEASNKTLSAIYLTHHHEDHSGGIASILDQHPVPVYGSPLSPYPHISHHLDQHRLHHGHTWLAIPGHTLCHVGFLAHGYLFCGDTLFSAGCGRNFEGSFKMLYQSLEKIRALPDHIALCPGHEYTLSNLEFALKVEPNNPAIPLAIEHIKHRSPAPSVPTLLGHERLVNPFLRCHLDAIQKSASDYAGRAIQDPLATFEVLRTWKNRQ